MSNRPRLALALWVVCASLFSPLLMRGGHAAAGERSPAGPPPPGMGAMAVGNPIPRTGDQPLLIILADFPDRAGLFTGQAWQQVVFGANGFVDYYEEVSYNQLRYTGGVVGLSGGAPVTNNATVAYVRLPNPLTYYADGQYGFKVGAGQFPRNSGGVVQHALQALNAAGFNFAPYANPATQRVENVVVVFAGSTYAYTRDPVNSLEATAYRLTWAGGGPYTTTSGQIIDNYTFCPDQFGNLSGQIARIGVCAHEHGHALGMPDLYDYSYTTSGAGMYDVMAYGTFGATGGLRPFHFGAYSKAFFGWAAPAIAATGTFTVTLGPAETGANFIRLNPFGNPASPEHFLLENRQPVGFDQDWTNYGLCAGLLIWHVDEAIVNNYPSGVNSLPNAGGGPHQGVTIVEADGQAELISPPITYGECADAWAVGRTWDAASTPAATLWSGAASGLAVTVVGESAGTLTLRLTVATPYRAYLPSVRR